MVVYSTYNLVLDSCSAGTSAASKNDLVVRDESDRIDGKSLERV